MTLNPNNRTLEVYNENVLEYIEKTPQDYTPQHKPLLDWLNFSLNLIPPGEKVLEIGSGSGREARYMRRKGFDVLCSDGAQGFVDYLRRQDENCIKLNLLYDDIPKGFPLILANAVLPHFTRQQLLKVLIRCSKALNKGGYLAFSVKEGQGDAWINEKFHSKRYVQYWQINDLIKLLKKANLDLVFLENDIPGDLPNHTWANITTRKY